MLYYGMGWRVSFWLNASVWVMTFWLWVGRNKTAIAEYIRNQLQEDIMYNQISFKEYIDPFTGSKNSKA